MLDTISSVNAPELDSRRSHALAVVMTMSNLLQNGGCCNASACDFFYLLFVYGERDVRRAFS